MKQREFNALRRPEGVRASHGEFRLAIRSLDNARRDPVQGEEPVDDQRSMPPQASGHLLHKRKPTAEGFGAPRVEELRRPSRGCVVPEPLTLLAEQMCPDALEVVPDQVGRPRGLVVRKFVGPLEHIPASLRERRLVLMTAQLGYPLPPHLIDCHVHAPHDWESLGPAQGLGNLFRDYVELRLLHVAAHETDSLPDIVCENREESSMALFSAFMRDSEQSLGANDLVDEREVAAAAAVLDLIDARLDTRQIPSGHPPQRCVFYRAKHVLPARVEGDSRISPRQPLRPASQEPAIACRQVPVAGRPWHTLDRHAADRAVDPPHRVHEKNRHFPERHKLKSSGCKPVISGPLPATARADRLAVRSRLDVHHEGALTPRDFDQPLRLVDKGLEQLDAIENLLEVLPAVAPAKGLSRQPHLYRAAPHDAFFLHWSPEGRCFQAAACHRTQAHAASGGPHQAAQTVTRCPRSLTRDLDSTSDAAVGSILTSEVTAVTKKCQGPIQKPFLPTDSVAV